MKKILIERLGFFLFFYRYNWYYNNFKLLQLKFTNYFCNNKKTKFYNNEKNILIIGNFFIT